MINIAEKTQSNDSEIGEIEQQVYYLLEENGNLERTIKAAYKACEQIEKNREELQGLMQELSKLYTNRGVKKNE